MRKFRDLSLLVISFLAGAVAGAILSPRMLNHTLWIITLPLVVVLLLVLKRSRRERAARKALR